MPAFNSNNKSVPAVWRPSGANWYILPGAGQGYVTQWGFPNDIPLVGDFDGDGKSDLAVWRPSEANWYILPSSTGQAYVTQWGFPTDIPLVGDFDGDGKSDLAVWRPSEGNWYIVPSSTGQAYVTQWGLPGDIPVVGDFDGDGRSDLAVWRPSEANWYILPSRTGQPYVTQWGFPNDIPLVGDFDGDGKSDLAVWRPSEANWYILPSSTGQPYVTQWGFPSDIPLVGDFDGDGRTDLVVWRPPEGNWYILPSSTGQAYVTQWGLTGDIPLPHFVAGPSTANLTISGQVTAVGIPFPAVTLGLSGSTAAGTSISLSATTDSSGSYSFAVPAGGSYTVTPSSPGFLFSPGSGGPFTNLSQSQSQDFTALPLGYSTGPSSIPASFTAAVPSPSCTDISGSWDSDDGEGNSVGWSLTGGNSGSMSFEAIDSFDGIPYDCGTVNYTVTGQQTGSLISLLASVVGQPYDLCGVPVPSTWTENVTLSGSACGVGGSTWTQTYNQGGPSAAISASRAANAGPTNFSMNVTQQRVDRMKAATLPASNSKAALAKGAHVAGVTPSVVSNAGVSSWTTITPRFSVQYASYIPVDHIAGPTPCLALVGADTPIVLGWLLYKGDANRGTYRTTQSVLAFNGIANAQGENWFAQGGPTRNYGFPSSPADGLNLSSTPTGDLYNAPYVGADEDNVPGDCHLWNDKGQASAADMQGRAIAATSSGVSVNLYGLGQDPLEPKLGGIKWNMTVHMDTSIPSNPSAWVDYTHTCYPAHTVKVNGTTVYDFQPTLNYTLELVGCLTNTLPELVGTTYGPNLIHVPTH